MGGSDQWGDIFWVLELINENQGERPLRLPLRSSPKAMEPNLENIKRKYLSGSQEDLSVSVLSVLAEHINEDAARYIRIFTLKSKELNPSNRNIKQHQNNECYRKVWLWM